MEGSGRAEEGPASTLRSARSAACDALVAAETPRPRAALRNRTSGRRRQRRWRLRGQGGRSRRGDRSESGADGADHDEGAQAAGPGRATGRAAAGKQAGSRAGSGQPPSRETTWCCSRSSECPVSRAEAGRKGESGVTTRKGDGLAEGMQCPDGARRDGERWMGLLGGPAGAERTVRAGQGLRCGQTVIERYGQHLRWGPRSSEGQIGLRRGQGNNEGRTGPAMGSRGQ